MKISDLCIGDGKVLSFKLEGSDLEILFEDYMDTKYSIYCNNCDYILEKGGIGFSLDKGKVDKCGGKLCWSLFDSDGKVIEFQFEGYEIKKCN